MGAYAQIIQQAYYYDYKEKAGRSNCPAYHSYDAVGNPQSLLRSGQTRDITPNCFNAVNKQL